MNTKTARHSLDMLHGSLIKKILLFALPIAPAAFCSSFSILLTLPLPGNSEMPTHSLPLVQTEKLSH